MTKSEFIAYKIPILMNEGKYSRQQATAIAYNLYEKEQQKAQQGEEKQYAQFGLYNGLPIGNAIKGYSTQYGIDPMDMQQIMQNQMQSPQQNFDPNYQAYLRNAHTPSQPNNSANQANQTYNTGTVESNTPSTLSNYIMPPMFSAAYGQTQNVPNQGEKFGSGGYDKSQYSSPTNTEGLAEGYEYDANGDVVEKKKKNQYVTNSVNIVDPTEGWGNPMYNLNRGMYNFGRGNTLGGIAGTGASLLGMARTGLLGYSQGKEDRRIEQEYNDKRFDRTPNYAYGQQGGRLKNSDVIAQNAITDQEGSMNINLEGGEFVMRNNGQVQPVVGEPHIKNGKKADGVDAQLEEGDKVLSNYVKLKPTDIKDLKERYNISLKTGATFAEAQKKLDQKLGIKKLETEKADILEKLEKANKIKDTDTKQLSLEVLSKKTGEVNEKLNTLSGVRASNFEHLFQLQEKQEKKGDGTQLFDKNGKEVTESNEGVAQQGKMINQADVNRINQNPYMQFTTEFAKQYFEREENTINNTNPNRAIRNIQGGVSNDKYGEGKYIYYDKLPTEQGFNVNKNREFVTQEAYTNNVLNSPAYQAYMQGQNTDRRVAGMQQGGSFESIAQKYGISLDRANELISMQQGGKKHCQEGGVQSEQEEIEEGQSSNAQEEQGEVSPQEIVEAFAQATQQDPQQIVAQLQKMAPEQQQQALSQMVQALQQGQQNPQEEQMEGQYSNEQNGVPQEEMETAQQGGQKRYAQSGTEYGIKAVQDYLAQWRDKPDYQYKDIAKTAERFKPFLDKYGVKYTDKELKTIGGLDNLAGKLQETISSKYPELAEDYGINIEPTRKGLQKLLDKGIIKKGEFGVETDNNGKVKIGSFNVLSADNQKGIKAKIDALTEKDKKEYAKSNYVDYESYFRTLDAKEIEFKDKAEYDKYLEDNKAKKIGDYYKTDKVGAYIKPIYKPSGTPPEDPTKPANETPPSYTGQPNQEVEAVNNVKNIPAIFPSFIPPYSPMQAIGKESAFLPRYESIKITPESMLAEQAAQNLAQTYAINQSGLSPQQQQAVLGRNLAQSQMAANDAISKAEQFNANNQWQTDNQNTGIRAKEDIMNAQYRQDYGNKVMQTLANKETQDYENYRTNFLQDQVNSNKIVNMNTANALNNQWAITPQGVIPLNNKPYEFKPDLERYDAIRKMTPEEYNVYKKMMGAKGIAV
jgi:hypothetical protein